MSSSLVPTTITAIVNVLEGAGLKVWDGPFFTSGDFADSVFVGHDADPDGQFESVTMHQDWAGTIGAKRRDEIFEVVCAVLATSGESDVATVRTNVFNLFATVENTLRANTNLGFPSPYVAAVRPRNLYIEPSPDVGFQARLVFVVEVKTRV